MGKISRPYRDSFLEALKDPLEAAEYLNAALEEGSQELFLIALQNVAEARGIKSLSDEVRSSLGLVRSEGSNPDLSSLSDLLGKLGLRLAVEVQEPVSA